MIYLDSAATSLQKPNSVGEAMLRAMRTASSPGRGSHRAAMHAADIVFDCRNEIAGLFHVQEPDHVVFTMNATHALNIAIGSLVHPGARVVVSGYEHNSVMRPLYMYGAQVVTAAAPLFDDRAVIDAFAQALPEADAVVCTHVSNVFGYILPVKEIAELCAAQDVPLIIDASQSAGCLPLDFSALAPAFVAMPGHKGLLGPQGTGVLLCADTSVRPLLSGGTGSNSALMETPDFLPDRLEAGTHNVTGVAGLLAGVRYVRAKGEKRILAHEQGLLRAMLARLDGIPGVECFVSASGNQSGVLSIRCAGTDCSAVAEKLGAHGIAVRAGLHCAPAAHRSADTFETGTVRFSFSPFNTRQEIEKAASILALVTKNM